MLTQQAAISKRLFRKPTRSRSGSEMRWGREGRRQHSPFICLQSTQAAHPNATWRSWEEAAPWEGAVSVSSSLFLIIIQLTSLVQESRDEIGSVFSESILLWGSCLEVNSATSNNKDCLQPKGGAGQMGINRMSGCSWGVKGLVLQLLHSSFLSFHQLFYFRKLSNKALQFQLLSWNKSP